MKRSRSRFWRFLHVFGFFIFLCVPLRTLWLKIPISSYMPFAAKLQKRPHFWLLALILLLAATLRCFDLSGLPMGLHGDEAITGYEARRILREGSIGPYSPATYGQPAGPMYFAALGVALGGDEILSIRALSAIFGVLTVLALFWGARAELNASTALIATFLLATLCWHVHYSRIAFPLIAWPLMCVLIIGATQQAQIRGQARWWFGAGFLNGLGVYTYKAHLLFGAIALGFAVWSTLRSDAATSRRPIYRWGCLGLYLVAAIVAANFLLRFALDPAHNYGGQFAQTSIFNADDWKTLDSAPRKLWFLIARYGSWWSWMIWRPVADYTDGAGIMPMISPVVAALSVVGFLAAKRRETLVQWSRWIVVLMPVAAVVTNDGLARRTLSLAPFLCVLAAIGAVEIVRWSRQFSGKRSFIARTMPGFVGTLLALHAALSWHAYFVTFARAPVQAWVFCDDLTNALAYMRSLPRERPIYFYSSRWSITYDTRKFLAPDLNARDASLEFSPDHQLLWPPPTEQGAVWIFLDSYQARAPELQAQFPNAKFLVGAPSRAQPGEPSFVVLEN